MEPEELLNENSGKDKESPLLSLEVDLKFFNESIREVAIEIMVEGLSQYPIFIAHQHELEAAIEELRAYRDDERGNVEPRDEIAVDEPAGDARRQRREKADGPWQAGAGGDEAKRRRAKPHDRGKRQVDLAGDDDEGQRQRDDSV